MTQVTKAPKCLEFESFVNTRSFDEVTGRVSGLKLEELN